MGRRRRRGNRFPIALPPLSPRESLRPILRDCRFQIKSRGEKFRMGTTQKTRQEESDYYGSPSFEPTCPSLLARASLPLDFVIIIRRRLRRPEAETRERDKDYSKRLRRKGTERAKEETRRGHSFRDGEIILTF